VRPSFCWISGSVLFVTHLWSGDSFSTNLLCPERETQSRKRHHKTKGRRGKVVFVTKRVIYSATDTSLVV
jgi:hypothetical protein